MTEFRQLSIWVTGCAGFLGTRLTGHLASLGHSVVGLSRRECGAERSFAIDLAAEDASQKLADLIREIGRPDVVIHAAAKQPGPGKLFDFIRSNFKTTENLVEALRHSPPPLIIYTSTQSVYAGGASLPVSETSPAPGKLPYSATKRWAEQLLESFAAESRVVVLRLPSLYGVGQADSFIDGLARLALRNEPIELFSGGQLIRDALHVSDVAEAVSSCLQQPLEKSFAVLNLGCGRAIRTREYAEALINALESKSVIVASDRVASQTDLYADIENARQLVGFQPTSLEQSMKIYAAELRA